MHRETATVYRCPYSGQPVELTIEHSDGLVVLSGSLISPAGHRYPIVDGTPHLIDAGNESFGVEEKAEHDYYQSTSKTYDSVLDWVFRSFYEDEDAVRNGMVDLLDLKPNSRVLETGCGTCRDSVYLARRLEAGGQLYLQDLSPNMLELGRRRMASLCQDKAGSCKQEFFVGNAAHLPFPAGFFDAAFHFGGLNLFTDKKQALAEMTRVVRPGGKVVVGDEGLAPWHRNTLYGNFLTNSNKLYLYQAPLDCIPECARDVTVRWFLGNAYYLIAYRVGESHPRIDLDLPILGKRGGTHRTRYHGLLEGVTIEAKALALDAAARSGSSIHEWLDRVVRAAAEGAVRGDAPGGQERAA